jgi:hypothetical protein
MDLGTFHLVHKKDTALSDKHGLYCVAQSQLPTEFSNVYRCGKATDIPHRMRVYNDYYITGGKVFYLMTVPKIEQAGYKLGVRVPQYLNTVEAEYHRHLVELGAQRVRGDRTEFFKATLSIVREAMLKTFKNRSGFNIYEVSPTELREINPVSASHSAPVMNRGISLRRTPRIALQSSQQESPQDETSQDVTNTQQSPAFLLSSVPLPTPTFNLASVHRRALREAARRALYEEEDE